MVDFPAPGIFMARSFRTTERQDGHVGRARSHRRHVEAAKPAYNKVKVRAMKPLKDMAK